MSTIYQAFAEVSDIIKHSEYELIKLIPSKFIEFIENNEDKDYEVNINYELSINEQTLLSDTREILAVIYRDYLCEESERNEIIEKSRMYEESLKEKYNVDNIFKNKKEKILQEVEEKYYLIKQDKWYQKFWNIIKRKIKIWK